jgi:hypothetical protein
MRYVVCRLTAYCVGHDAREMGDVRRHMRYEYVDMKRVAACPSPLTRDGVMFCSHLAGQVLGRQEHHYVWGRSQQPAAGLLLRLGPQPSLIRN